MGPFLRVDFASTTGVTANAVSIDAWATGPGKVSAAAQWSTAEMVWSFVWVGVSAAFYVFGAGLVASRTFQQTLRENASQGLNMARWRTLPLVLEIATFACFSGLGADRIAGERVTAWPEGALVWAALAVVGLLWVAWGRRLYAGQVRAVAAERALTAERAGTPIPAVPK